MHPSYVTNLSISHPNTHAKAFAVASKNPQALRDRLRREAAQRAARLREFHATGIPSHSPELPAVPVKPATVPEPFEFPGESISKRKKQDFENKVIVIVMQVFSRD